MSGATETLSVLDVVPPAIPSERTSAGIALVSFTGQAISLCGDVQMMQ